MDFWLQLVLWFVAYVALSYVLFTWKPRKSEPKVPEGWKEVER